MTIRYAYDTDNQLVRRTADSDGPGPGGPADTFYFYENGQVVLQFDGPAVADLSHRYLWGPQVDQLLADEAVASLTAPGSVLWPLGDHLGTIRDLATYDDVADDTTIANHRQYDSFGNLYYETNAAIDELFGYTGRLWDEDTELQYNLNRWYDPATGNWLSEDPIGFLGGDSNLARYVSNNPLSFVDPSGLFEIDWGSAAAGAAHSALSATFPMLTQVADESISNYQDMYAVWNNSADYGLAQRLYMTQGIGLANAVGVRGVSDFCSRRDAVSGREQSATERAIDGINGAGRLAAVAGAGVAALRAGGRAPRLTQQQQYQQQQGNGSYTNTHQSGKTYSGKGNQSRMNKSARDIANEHGDPVVSKDHTTAADTKQSFIDEQCRIDANGGPGGNTYNKINSPGKNLRGGK